MSLICYIDEMHLDAALEEMFQSLLSWFNIQPCPRGCSYDPSLVDGIHL
jgi:hypothetical protein